MTMQLSAIVGPWVEEAISRHGEGERVLWDMTLALSGSGPAYCLVMFMPGAIVGTHIHASMIVTNIAAITQPDIDDLVAKLLEGVRQQRSQQLEQVHHPLAPAPGANGNGG